MLLQKAFAPPQAVGVLVLAKPQDEKRYPLEYLLAKQVGMPAAPPGVEPVRATAYDGCWLQRSGRHAVTDDERDEAGSTRALVDLERLFLCTNIFMDKN